MHLIFAYFTSILGVRPVGLRCCVIDVFRTLADNSVYLDGQR